MDPDYTYELRFLQAAEESLKTYLLSNEIYWPLSVRPPAGEPPYPRFSLGWLLLFTRRLQPVKSEPAVSDALTMVEETRREWLSAWQKKAGLEFQARLRLWSQYLNDYRSDRSVHASRYRYEVQRRTMLELLQVEAEAIPAEQLDLLATLDAVLRGSLKPGPFIRERQDAAAFPKDRFWFLYGELKS